jgi:hypothetical protein
MIFQETWQMILDGSKTQTRRLVHGDRDLIWATSGGQIVSVARWNAQGSALRIIWEVGRTYAVRSSRGKKAVARIKITRIRQQHLQEISIEDAEAEGLYCGDQQYANVSNFIVLWQQIHTKPGTRWQDNPAVWALDFELVE